MDRETIESIIENAYPVRMTFNRRQPGDDIEIDGFITDVNEDCTKIEIDRGGRVPTFWMPLERLNHVEVLV